MEDNDHEYYRRRAEEEMRRAKEADPATSEKHRQLAAIYLSRALRAERQDERDQRSG